MCVYIYIYTQLIVLVLSLVVVVVVVVVIQGKLGGVMGGLLAPHLIHKLACGTFSKLSPAIRKVFGSFLRGTSLLEVTCCPSCG